MEEMTIPRCAAIWLCQRIPRYRLLLETILQHTAIESSMHSKVEESLTTMGGIASKIDADLSLQEQKDKVRYGTVGWGLL